MAHSTEAFPILTLMAPSLLTILLCVGGTCRAAPEGLTAPEGLSQQELASFGYVMMGMKENRDRLKTGVFRAYGVYSELDKERGDLHENAEIYCAFDRPNNRVRFDRSLPFRQLLTSEERKKENQPQGSWKVGVRKTQVICTPTQFIDATAGGGSVKVYTPEQSKARAHDLPFDARALGLYYWAGFAEGFAFEDVFKPYADKKPRAIEGDKEGKWKIAWETSKGVWSKDILWVDEAKGFTVIRSENYSVRKAASSAGKSEPTHASEVTWALSNEVWVPKTFRIQQRTKDKVLSFDLAFEWDSVNQPVPDVLFTIEGLKLRNRRLVVNEMTGQHIVTDILNDSPGHTSYARKPTAAPVSSLPSFWWLLLVNGLLVVVAVVFLYMRYRRRRRSAEPGPR